MVTVVTVGLDVLVRVRRMEELWRRMKSARVGRGTGASVSGCFLLVPGPRPILFGGGSSGGSGVSSRGGGG
ncbi:hypothetical protein Sm713_61420 [Streptomyces sp. TS71-3]|nr:hypothetical protein Sm713_61420 [Streptomyces sp. TS71-3]